MHRKVFEFRLRPHHCESLSFDRRQSRSPFDDVSQVLVDRGLDRFVGFLCVLRWPWVWFGVCTVSLGRVGSSSRTQLKGFPCVWRAGVGAGLGPVWTVSVHLGSSLRHGVIALLGFGSFSCVWEQFKVRVGGGLGRRSVFV